MGNSSDIQEVASAAERLGVGVKAGESAMRKLPGIPELVDAINRLSISANSDPHAMLTLDEAALFLGLRESTLLTLTAKEQIPFYKPHGKFIYFDKSELLEWLRAGHHPVKE